MTDKELLEKAAKAAGIKISKDPNSQWRNCTNAEPAMNIFAFPLWNPLTDDGDALRLAVKLRMRVATPTSETDCAIAGKGDVRGVHVKAYSEDAITDNCEATRRAIVLAAAEIGAKE